MIAWAGIQPDQIDLYWPHVKTMFGDVIERSPERFTEASVVAELKAGHYQLWITHEAAKLAIALVTEIVSWEGGKYCRLQMVGGKNLSRSAQTIHDVIVAWAKENGCDALTCLPREGLGRILSKHFGFQFVKQTSEGPLFYKDLENNDTRVH